MGDAQSAHYKKQMRATFTAINCTTKGVSMKLITWTALGWLALMATAQAASFDCNKAKTDLEKTICTNPKISSLDDDLNKSYIAAMKLLSDDGKAILKKSQSQWLRYLNTVCIKYKEYGNAPECVERKYFRRVKDMKTAAVQIGPYLFSRIDYFYAEKSSTPVDNFNPGWPMEGQTAYPRIDSPLSDSALKWNKAMALSTDAQRGFCDGGQDDSQWDYEIKYATDKIISARLSQWTYCHGTPHGHGDSDTNTFVLKPKFHLLQSSDLFASDKEWVEYLARRCFDVLDKEVDIGRSSSDTQVDRNEMRKEILAIVSDTGSWSFTKDALVITFNTGTIIGFGYAGGEHSVTISWNDLKQFLAPNNAIFFSTRRAQ